MSRASERSIEIVAALAACDHDAAETAAARWCIRCGAYRLEESGWLRPTIAATAVALARELETERKNGGG